MHKEGYLEVFMPKQIKRLFERWKTFRLGEMELVVEIEVQSKDLTESVEKAPVIALAAQKVKLKRRCLIV